MIVYLSCKELSDDDVANDVQINVYLVIDVSKVFPCDIFSGIKLIDTFSHTLVGLGVKKVNNLQQPGRVVKVLVANYCMVCAHVPRVIC